MKYHMIIGSTIGLLLKTMGFYLNRGQVCNPTSIIQYSGLAKAGTAKTIYLFFK